MTIPWDANEPDDDFTAFIGDYCLRVEQMDDKVWWWRTYYKNDTIADAFTDGLVVSSAKQGKKMAVWNMLKHQMKII